MQFAVFGREIPCQCETAATRKVTVKQLIHTTAETIGNYSSLIDIFTSIASGIQTCPVRIKPNRLLSELSRRPKVPTAQPLQQFLTRILTSRKGRNSVANLQNLTLDIPNLDIINVNVHAKFG